MAVVNPKCGMPKENLWLLPSIVPTRKGRYIMAMTTDLEHGSRLLTLFLRTWLCFGCGSLKVCIHSKIFRFPCEGLKLCHYDYISLPLSITIFTKGYVGAFYLFLRSRSRIVFFIIIILLFLLFLSFY